MKVILTEKVAHLGNVGEVVNVSQGHARNFLIPSRLAVLADESNKKQLEDSKRRLAKKIEAEKGVALETKKKLDGMVIELVKKVGGNGKLFGTVTTMELSKELSAKDVEVERRVLVIDNPIKTLGTFEVKAKLFPEVEGSFKVKVVIDPKQAEELEKKREAAEKRAAAEKKAAAEKAKNDEGKEDEAKESEKEEK